MTTTDSERAIEDLTIYWWGRDVPLDAAELARQTIVALRETGYEVRQIEAH